jgi:hypothetical protein
VLATLGKDKGPPPAFCGVRGVTRLTVLYSPPTGYFRALAEAAKKLGKELPADVKVNGYTHLGYTKANELRLAATLKVDIPGFDSKTIDELNKACVTLLLNISTNADLQGVGSQGSRVRSLVQLHTEKFS